MLDSDPFHHACLAIHLACQVELRDTNGLFYLAHKLVDSYPTKAVSAHRAPGVGGHWGVASRHTEQRHCWCKAWGLRL